MRCVREWVAGWDVLRTIRIGSHMHKARLRDGQVSSLGEPRCDLAHQRLELDSRGCVKIEVPRHLLTFGICLVPEAVFTRYHRLEES